MALIGDPPVDRWGGGSLTARQARCLRLVCDVVPDVYASPEGRYAPDDAWPLSELPDWVLCAVNPRWRQRFLMVFGELGARVGFGETPRPRCFAERVALWIAFCRARWIAEDAPSAPDDADEDWDRLRDLMFGDDLDFCFIWRGDVPSASPMSSWHPYRWWDGRAADLPPAA